MDERKHSAAAADGSQAQIKRAASVALMQHGRCGVISSVKHYIHSVE